VTWLVEGRALDVYGIYKKALGESEIARKLGSVLAEETKHLADVEALLKAADPGFSARSQEFEAVKSSFYQTFIDALTKELSQSSQVAAVVAT
jgi:rubrerythrin